MFIHRTSAINVAGLIVLVLIAPLCGCIGHWKAPSAPCDTKKSYYDSVATRIEYPDVANFSSAASSSATATGSPHAFEDPSKIPAWEMTLEEAIRLAIGQSPVIRNLGGTIVNAPQSNSTIYDPALTEANPLGGVEAALADFDAQFVSQLFRQRNDRPQNVFINPILAQFQRESFQQRLVNYSAEINKTTATGASFAARHNVVYDHPNSPGRRFPSDFSGFFEAEYRQPLMRGRGVMFNRIAGPNSQPGQYNGVLIARINTDISVADFESSIINLASEVEQAYWNLYFAYRNLEAQLRGRESALQTFQYQKLRLDVGAGRSDEEAQARSQFFQFQVQVENGLAGDTGLYKLEQRLRYLLGLPASDGRLIRPASDPLHAEVVFDWSSALGQSLSRRVELRRQKWNIKRRELELFAARLNKQPQLDFLGQYRWRGMGDHLLGHNDRLFDNLYQVITDGDYQEWQAGLELSFPIGFRRASVAISHAQLNLTRERALLGELELRISHDLADSSRELQRQFQLLETNYNRWKADQRQLEVLRERYLRGADNINFLLQAQRQVVQSESEYYQTLIAYNFAIRDLHQSKGTLLAYNHIHLSEGGWHGPAYRDAYERGRHMTPRLVPSETTRPRPVSRGSFNPSASATTTLPGQVEDLQHQQTNPDPVVAPKETLQLSPSDGSNTTQNAPVQLVPQRLPSVASEKIGQVSF